ncbi:hypothetical protein NLJ89_g9023 [Agrocybe chaxingu]|uniref:Uncharacterized protein n=1 Tax=Agrocybe chaxingu TaxID=84603 RepID=A0A9W8MTI8_9AGAR|nr:hypothetical protein NLJ89_g9023 [Agrocybe chaxingu]
MAASALFSQDIMSSFTDFAPLPRQPQPRHLLQPHLLSARDTTDNHLNHWLSQQYHMQHHQPMGRINTSLASSTRQQEATVDEMGGSDYTFTTHPPNDDALGLGGLGLYMYPNQMPMQQNVASSPHHSRSAFSNNQWNQTSSYSSANEHTLTAQPYMMANFSHSQESINNTLSPYLVSTSPSTHMSPTCSDPSLSPLYSASSRLPTPTTPGSTSQSFKRSPTMTNEMLFVMDPAQQESSSGSDRPRYTHREQLNLFREALNLPMDGAGPFIPQMMYKPHTTSDRKRYVEDITLEAPLYFYSEHSTQCGILLKDALQSRTKKLRDRDMVVFEGRGPSVSIRLEVSPHHLFDTLSINNS